MESFIIILILALAVLFIIYTVVKQVKSKEGGCHCCSSKNKCSTFFTKTKENNHKDKE